MSRRVKINLLVFNGVFAVFLYWAVQNIVTIDAIERPYEMTAEFDAAAGVLPDAEVSYLGVRYGRVGGIDLMPGGVTVSMKIDRGKEIPAGSTFAIFRKSAVGEPYILVTPPEDYEGGGPFHQAGDHIALDSGRTTTPLEFAEMLRSASAVVASLDPERVGGLVHELALGLAGNEDELRALAAAGDTLTAAFASRTDALDRLATNNTRLTRVVSEHRDDLERAMSGLRQVAGTLRSSEGDLIRVLEDAGPALGLTANVVAANKGNLDCILSDLEGVLVTATTESRLDGLEVFLQNGPEAFAGTFATREQQDDGIWVRVGVYFQDESPATQYTPFLELPETPAVPACGSTLRPASSGDFRPIGGGSTLPATGGKATLVLALAVIGGAGALRAAGHPRPTR
ncbi:MAG TPA: MCE family protein [Acidimicrobiales bacterium]